MKEEVDTGSLTFLKSFLKLPRMNEEQRDLFQWQVDNATPVKIQSYTVNEELREMVDNHFLASYTPRIKECYRTAGTVVGALPEIDYIEGYTTGVIPFQHAWNAWNGIHFDLTAEKAGWEELNLEKSGKLSLVETYSRFTDYQQVIRFNFEELMKYLDSERTLGGELIQEYYWRTVVEGDRNNKGEMSVESDQAAVNTSLTTGTG